MPRPFPRQAALWRQTPTPVTVTNLTPVELRAPRAPPLIPQLLEPETRLSVLICPPRRPISLTPCIYPSATHTGSATKARPQLTCCSPWSQPPSPNARGPPTGLPASTPAPQSILGGHGQLLNMHSLACPCSEPLPLGLGGFNLGSKDRLWIEPRGP